MTTRFVAGLLLAGAAAAVGLAVVWLLEGSVQLQGLLLGLSFLLIGAALGVWANRLTDNEDATEPRPSLAPSPETELSETDVELPTVGRRDVLVRASLVAGGALGAAALVPIRELGPDPGKQLLRTGWRSGRRVVTIDGEPVQASDIPLDGLVTAFPEGEPGSADGQLVVIRVPSDDLDLPAGRDDWAATGGLVAYSKVCTHAGCPVGLYSSETRQLLCPCHQSAFDVLRGAEPLSGPAAWPLPQLPLMIDGAGVVQAAGELSAPVGTGWWRSEP